jgi:hypothetical protein
MTSKYTCKISQKSGVAYQIRQMKKIHTLIMKVYIFLYNLLPLWHIYSLGFMMCENLQNTIST